MCYLIIQLFVLLFAKETSATVKDLVNANSKLGLDLYLEMTKSNQENIIFSPASISFALAMTSLGAKANTLEEMRKATHVTGLSNDQIHRTYKELMKELIIKDNSIHVSLANRLFIQENYKILPEFLASSKNNYNSEPQSVQFDDQAKTTSIINDWVSENTFGKINDIVSEGDMGILTRLFIVNALYFKAEWGFEFKIKKKRPFMIDDSTTSETDFLHDPFCEGKYGRHETFHYEVFETKFYNYKFSFGIILPDLKKTSLRQVEMMLKNSLANQTPLNPATVNVTFPKFKMESKFELVQILKNLGIKDLFNAPGADLSGIEPEKKLFVEGVIHKANIEVTEFGVVAAAATVSKVSIVKVPQVDVTFTADHPFLYYIKHESGEALFFGRYSKP